MKTPDERGTPAQGNIVNSKQTEYERKNGLISKEEIIKNVPGLMKNLSDVDFHSYYHLLWTLSTHRMLERIRRQERGDE